MNVYRILLIVSICLLLVCVVFGIMLWWPKLQTYNNLNIQLKSVSNELERKQQYYSKIESDLEQVKTYSDEIAKIDAAFPEDASISLPVLLNFIIGKSAEHGLVLGGIGGDVSSIQKGDLGVDEFSFSISTEGSYASLKDFLSGLYKNSRIFEVNSLQFASSGDKEKRDVFSFALSLKSYFNIDKTEGQKAPGVPTGAPKAPSQR